MKKKFKDSEVLSGNFLRQLFFIMKLTLFFLMTSALGLFATGSYSQNTRVTLDLKSVTVKEALKAIENTSEFFFIYNNELINVDRKIDLNVKNQKITEVLNNIFGGRDVEITVIDRKIVLAPAFMGEQQGKKVTGKVTDSSGGSLPGVSVVVKGTTTGIITDADGNYSLSNIPANAILQFSFVGMKTQDIAVGNKTTINVTLAEETVGIEEVVAIGYGTMKKINLTGAVSNINNEEIQATTSTALVSKLQGKISGLNIRQNSGQPGTFNNSINIRGFGAPLYVVDGIITSAVDFQKINSEDIESMSVLKDASAAIYGLNASNGVIIITTKKGKEGKAEFQFSSNVSLSAPTNIVQMANAYEYLTLRNESNLMLGLSELITKEELAKWKAGGPGYESTDWKNETFKKNSLRKEYSLSAQGGSKNISYYININKIKDGGLLKSNDIFYDKLSLRSNISAKLTDNLTTNVRISGYFDETKSPIAGIFSIWRGIVSSLPIHSVYANNNPNYFNRVTDGQSINPVPQSRSDVSGYTQNKDQVFEPQIDLIYKVPFIKGLELKGSAGYIKRFNMGKNVRINYNLYDYNSANDTYISTTYNNPPSIYNGYNNSSYLTLLTQMNYKTTIADDHTIDGMLAFEQKDNFTRYAGLNKYYDFYTNDQLDQATNKDATSWGNEVEQKFRSYIGRLNYNYKGKYIIEFSGRYDGSYRYHPDSRWGFFPQISGGWRISEENFMKTNFPNLSNLKIRSSYGTIGEDAGAPFQYLAGFSTSGGGYWEFTNGKETQGIASPGIVNKNLTWMNSTIINIGIDLGLFDNKLSFTADIYQKTRTGLLAYRSISVPNTFGGTFPQENLNSDRIKGIEFSFNYHNKIREVNYNISGNINYNRKMNLYVEHPPFGSSWNQYRYATGSNWFWGSSIGAPYRYSDVVWGYDIASRFNTDAEIQTAPVQNGANGNKYVLPGDLNYTDRNGDGVIDGNDLMPLFNDDNPKMNYGSTIDVDWKNFYASILFQGAAMFTKHYTHAYTMPFFPGDDSNLPAYFMDRWHMADPYNPNSKWIAGEWPAVRTATNTGMLYNENKLFRRDASYFRFKNLTLGYNFNSQYFNKIGIKDLKVYFNATNIFTLTDKYLKAFDPETQPGFLQLGWIYPIMKTYSIGVNINF